MQDLISVIMPVKNGEKYISEALENIRKQDMNVEIIVVDDGSDDRTSEIAKNYNCTVIRNDISKGQVVAKNQGLKAAHGKYIMFHDHDDIMRENALKTLYNELQTDNSLSAAQAKVKDFYSPDMEEKEKQKTFIKQDAYHGLFTGAILMRKKIFDIIGLFPEKFNTGEIIEWQTKMDSNNLQIKKLDFISTNRRLHSSNYGKTNRQKEFVDYAAILRARLKNKR